MPKTFHARARSSERPREAEGVEIGQIYYASWGYEQTNNDFVKVVGLSPSGKTAIVKRMKTVQTETSSMVGTEIPTEVFGESFRLKVDMRDRNAEKSEPELVGTAPDLGYQYFWLWKGEPVHYSSYG